MAYQADPWRQTNLTYRDATVTNIWKIAGLLVVVAGCGSSNEPVVLPLPSGPSEAELVDFAGDDILDPSAFDILDANDKRTDQVPGWDFLFQLGPDTVALRPRSEVTTVAACLATVWSRAESAPLHPRIGPTTRSHQRPL